MDQKQKLIAESAIKLILDAESAIYDFKSSAVIKGRQSRIEAQDKVDRVLDDYKRHRCRALNSQDIYLTVRFNKYGSLQVVPSAALDTIVREYHFAISEEVEAEQEKKIKEQEEDPFYQWLNSLNLNNTEVADFVKRVARDFHDERDIARFVFSNAPAQRETQPIFIGNEREEMIKLLKEIDFPKECDHSVVAQVWRERHPVALMMKKILDRTK